MIYISKYKLWIIFFFIFFLNIFLRFYQIEIRNPFGWDQVDNAWAAVNIIVHHKFPLLGMVAKGNSGIYIGPLYYYLLSIFYFFTNLDPSASGLFAGSTAIFSFLVLFYITKKIFSFQTALIAVFLSTVASSNILFDRVQWPVDFIPAVSLIIFYCLYKIITGTPKYLIPLAFAFGFSLHIHFTSIFYPIIFICSLPFFPWKKETFKYIALSVLLTAIWLIPNVVFEIQNKHTQSGSFFKYGSTYYHGFHLTRVLQLAKDAFIQFEAFLIFPVIKFLKYVILPLFSVYYYYKNKSKNAICFLYLLWLWFVVPWFVFATYSGEISDYYFSINRYIVVVLLAYFISEIFSIKLIVSKVFTLVGLSLYMIYNINVFFHSYNNGLNVYKESVRQAIKQGRVIQFTEGDPESYLYYIYTIKKKNENK